jgi:SRSO17 transposase
MSREGIVEICGTPTAEFVALDQWTETLAEVQRRIARRFRRVEVRERVGRYLAGLLGRVERKNGWQLAEAMGEADPHGVQRLLNGAVWDADAVRDDLRAYVVEHLGDATSGVLIVDETGFLKQGTCSCGVAPQYSGTAGTTANAQVGVFLAYAADRGTAFIDRALYLPRAWTSDPARRAAAGIPQGARFVTKVALARRLLTRAFAAAVPARWVVADAFYGRSHAFRRWLEQRGRAYVLMLPKTTAIQYRGRRERAEQLGARLSEAAGRIPATGTNSQAAGAHQWACLTLTDPAPDGMRRWLRIHRRTGAPGDLAYHLAYGPEGTTVEELVRVCSVRWQIEEGFAQAKGEIGLDHYEARGWVAWHRWVTLCLLAHAYLVVLRQRARAPDPDVRDDAAEPDLLPLTVPEVRRLVLALAEPTERRAFRLGWSRWRRAHQARAARCHDARAAPGQHSPDSTRVALLPAKPSAALTDAEWAGVLPLLPPRRPTTGRPRHKHRTVLSGIVWVFRTDASWRAMPKECGKWETAYKRYRLWRDEGRWQRIAAALGLAEREVAL